MDVLESLRISVGCTYISDLRFEPYCSEVEKVLISLGLDSFSYEDLNNILQYVYGKPKLGTKEDIIGFLVT